MNNLSQKDTAKFFVTSLHFGPENKRETCQRIKLKMTGLLLYSSFNFFFQLNEKKNQYIISEDNIIQI